jgi:hypothetical protein
MPIYHQKKTTQEETRQEIETLSSKYLLTLRISETSTMIYIGGITAWCIECQIIHNSNTANLVKIVYDEKCSLSGKFKRGQGTKELMALLLAYIHNNYPYIHNISFDDYSYRECSDKERIDLAYFYYLLEGETWYMKTMGAKFLNTEHKTYFTIATQAFNELKTTMSWDTYDIDVTVAHPLVLEEMKALFHEHKTWQSFFQALKDKVDIADLCIYMTPWITNFVKKYAKLYFNTMKFVMPVPNTKLPVVSYTLKPYIRNGGKYTRKYSKSRYPVDLR